MPLSPSKGAPALIDGALLRHWPLPAPPVDAGKEGRGKILIVGGARQMPGAVILAATAALRVGAGKLQIATVKSVATAVATAMPESFVHSLAESRDGGFHAGCAIQLAQICSTANAIILGPGMIENGALESLVSRTLARLGPEHTVVLDAGALTALHAHRARFAKFSCALVVTPHAGEMAKLLGQEKDRIEQNALQMVRDAARILRAIAILKGSETLISDGTTIYRNEAGNVGLATSGSGDTLSGLIGGLIARGASPFQAAVWGVHLHARAGEMLAKTLAPLGYLPRELLGEIPALMASFGKKPHAVRQKA